MLTDEHKLVRKTKKKKLKERERVSVSRQQKALRGYIEQKQMPIESNKTRKRLSFYIYIYMDAQLD
jgi:hypothetical protein